MSEARGGWMELGPHEALTMGADLWIIADLGDSAWARKIDWYLNFQLSRAAHHTRREISPELASTAESWEFDPPVIALKSKAPLLVASSKFLPNHMTVQVFASNRTTWVEEVREASASLNPSSVRVFLPSDLDPKQFKTAWGDSKQTNLKVTIVQDHGARAN